MQARASAKRRYASYSVCPHHVVRFGNDIRLLFATALVAMALALLPCSVLAEDYAPAIKLPASDAAQGVGLGSSAAISGDVAVVGAGSNAAYVYRLSGGRWAHEQKLTASDEEGASRFGHSVAISGDTIVVGAYGVTGGFGNNYGAAYVFRHNGTRWVEEQILSASDGSGGDYFGYSVAVSGDTIVVGAYGDHGGVGLNSGSVYVYRYDGESWVEEDRLAASDASSGDLFGFAVAMQDDTVVVGAYGDGDNGAFSGSVYIFRYDGANWGEDDKLTASDGVSNNCFGGSVAIAGDLIVVGPAFPFLPRPGEAYVFRYDGADWQEEDILTPPGVVGFEKFGSSVAVSGETVTIGAPERREGTTAYAGSAFTFWNDGMSWQPEGDLTNPDGAAFEFLGTAVAISGRTVLATAPGDAESGSGSGAAQLFLLTPRPDAKLVADDGEQYDLFGDAVAISGNTALVGAPDDDDDGGGSGSAYLFAYDGENWMASEKLTPSDAAPDLQFGASVALDGDTAVVGAPGQELLAGAAYVFRFNGGSWNQDPRLLPNDSAPEDQFGASVAISGNTLVIGASNHGSTEFDNGPGAAYVFALDAGNWTQVAKLVASDGDFDDRFGASVAISGDTIAVGSEFDDDHGIDAGAAYVFHFNGSNWVDDGKIVAAEVEADDAFGRSVGCSGDTVVVGTPRDDDNGNGAGAAYIFGYDGMNWVEETKLIASDGATVDRFGHSVAISSENTIVIGAEFDDQKGSAYVFWFDESEWIEDPKLIAPDRGTDYFGASVAISGDTVLVGVPYSGIDDTGAAYVSTVGYVGEIVPEPSEFVLHLAALAALGALTRRRNSKLASRDPVATA